MTLALDATAEGQDLTQKDYEQIRRLVYAKSGIHLGDEKMPLVRARLGKYVRQGGFGSFRDYFRHVVNDPTGEALCGLLDAISTNTTHMFREIRHFDLLGELLDGWLADRTWRADHAVLRIWSAGCSSGEEPYSIAMVAHDALSTRSDIEFKLLATDLSVQMLSEAKCGRYPAHRVGTVRPEFRRRYLRPVRNDEDSRVEISPELRRTITFARLNLIDAAFPFRHPFDVIFCRNVMIYFDTPTRTTLVNKFAQHLGPGGHLMIGHSESLNGIEHPLAYVEPTVYRKA